MSQDQKHNIIQTLLEIWAKEHNVSISEWKEETR